MFDTDLAYLSDSDGKRTHAVVPIAVYERLVACAVDDEDAEDRAALTAAEADDDGFRLPLEQARRLALGENVVKVLREWRGWDQAELASRLDSTRNYVSQIETGARRGVRKAEAFAEALGVPVTVLRAYL